MTNRYAILGLLLFAPFFAHAQEVQKCCGTGSSTFLLGSTNYARHTQCLYAPGELTGAVPGNIHKLYYRYGNSGIAVGNTLDGITIAMRQIPQTSFTGTAFLGELQTVLHSTSITIPPGASGAWFSIDLDTPFPFDPTLSLVVDINFQESSNTSFGTMSVGIDGRKLMSPSTTDPNGESWSTLQDIGFDLIQTGIGHRVLDGARMYPNPATEMVSLEWTSPLAEAATLELADVTGKAVRRLQLPAGAVRASLPTAQLAAGSYLVLMRGSSGVLFRSPLLRQ